MADHTFPSLTLSTGYPQGCILLPWLYTLYTYDYIAKRSSNPLVKFSDDTMIITNDDEGGRETPRGVVHRQQPLPHCQQNQGDDEWL